jgi:hypothetical protein
VRVSTEDLGKDRWRERGEGTEDYYTEQMPSTFCFDKHGLRRPIAWICGPECAGGTFAQRSNIVLRHSQPKGWISFPISLFGTTDRKKTLGRSPLPVLDGVLPSQGGSCEPRNSRVRASKRGRAHVRDHADNPRPLALSIVMSQATSRFQCGRCREGGLSVGQFETTRPGVQHGAKTPSINFPAKSPE